jgi:hypothetical protein
MVVPAAMLRSRWTPRCGLGYVTPSAHDDKTRVNGLTEQRKLLSELSAFPDRTSISSSPATRKNRWFFPRRNNCVLSPSSTFQSNVWCGHSPLSLGGGFCLKEMEWDGGRDRPARRRVRTISVDCAGRRDE